MNLSFLLSQHCGCAAGKMTLGGFSYLAHRWQNSFVAAWVLGFQASDASPQGPLLRSGPVEVQAPPLTL